MTDKSDDIEGFTPGPWFAGKMRGWAGLCVRRFQAPDVAGDHPVATVHDGYTYWDNKFPAEANAGLIAAAPDLHAENIRLRRINADLYEALEASVEFMNTVDPEIHTFADIEIARARAALERSKAQGHTEEG